MPDATSHSKLDSFCSSVSSVVSKLIAFWANLALLVPCLLAWPASSHYSYPLCSTCLSLGVTLRHCQRLRPCALPFYKNFFLVCAIVPCTVSARWQTGITLLPWQIRITPWYVLLIAGGQEWIRRRRQERGLQNEVMSGEEHLIIIMRCFRHEDNCSCCFS